MNAPAKITAGGPAVYSAIAAVQGELAKVGIAKESENTSQNYKFRGIDAVYGALSPLLAKHGLCVLPRIVNREMHERVTIKEWNGQKKESVLFYVTVEAEFDFVAVEDGSAHTVRTYGEAMDSGDKATNKAMSAAYKYAAFMAFAIPTEGDNDADATTHEVSPRNEPAPRQKLEGKYPSKSQLQAALREFVNKLLAADSVETVDALELEYAEALTQCQRDLPVWWEGDGTPEKRGVAGQISDKRESFGGMVFELIRSMKECETLKSLTAWMKVNEHLVDDLNDIDRRRFEKEMEAFEAGLTLVAQRN
jgi:hypothetical protein